MIWRPEVVPPVTQELKGRKQNHFGFWNISSRPTSVASFIEIGQPKFPTSRTLSQTMTLKNTYTHEKKTYRSKHCAFVSKMSWNLPLLPIFLLWHEPLSRLEKLRQFVSIFCFCPGLAFSLGPRDPKRIDRDERQ